MNTLKYLWNLVGTVKQLERDVENLENKVLAPEKVEKKMHGFAFLYDSMFDYWDGKNKTMSLEEKVDALAKKLGVYFAITDEKESEVVVKSLKAKKAKK